MDNIHDVMFNTLQKMECKKSTPNVTLATSPCDEGTARYVSMGESGLSTGQVCDSRLLIQDILQIQQILINFGILN